VCWLTVQPPFLAANSELHASPQGMSVSLRSQKVACNSDCIGVRGVCVPCVGLVVETHIAKYMHMRVSTGVFF
jgi:hypothetical protein